MHLVNSRLFCFINLARSLLFGLLCLWGFSVCAKVSTDSAITGHSTIEPFMHIVRDSGVDELTLTIPDTAYENAQLLSSQAASGDAVFQRLGSYQSCILSNDVLNGIVLKVQPSNNTNYIVEEDAVMQIAMFNPVTSAKIRLLFVVTPAGWSKNPKSFGNISSDGTQTRGVPFTIGGRYDNGNDGMYYLKLPQDRTLGGAIRLSNLLLDNFGMINHYGLNKSLSADDISIDRAIDPANLVMHGCVGDRDLSRSVHNVDMTVTFELYMNVSDLVEAPAGDYKTEYTIHWADSDDISAGVTVYDKS